MPKAESSRSQRSGGSNQHTHGSGTIPTTTSSSTPSGKPSTQLPEPQVNYSHPAFKDAEKVLGELYNSSDRKSRISENKARITKLERKRDALDFEKSKERQQFDFQAQPYKEINQYLRDIGDLLKELKDAIKKKQEWRIGSIIYKLGHFMGFIEEKKKLIAHDKKKAKRG